MKAIRNTGWLKPKISNPKSLLDFLWWDKNPSMFHFGGKSNLVFSVDQQLAGFVLRNYCSFQYSYWLPKIHISFPFKFRGRGIEISFISGLSLRARGRGFSPASTSLSPGYFDTKRKYWKEKNASNYKIMN